MQLFQSNQKSFEMMGLSSNLHRFNFKALMTFLLYWTLSILYGTFTLLEANEFREYMDSVYLTSATTVMAISFMIFVWKTEDIFHLIHEIEEIVEMRLKEPTLIVLYDQTIRQVEKWCDFIYHFMAQATPMAWVLPKFFGCMFIYFTTDLGSDALELPLPIWFPFDVGNLLGYLIAVTLLYIMTAHNFLFISAATTYAIAFLLYIVTITDDLKRCLNSINGEAKKKKKNRQYILQQLKVFIQLHSMARQLVHQFSGIWQPVYTGIFTWSLVTVCAAMLMFQIELTQPEIDIVLLSVTIFYSSYAFGIILISCEVGQRVTDSFEEINDVIDLLDKYKLPLDIKRMLPTVMIIAQEEIYFECFGSISCVRESFKKVINGGYSYFMVLREFTK